MVEPTPRVVVVVEAWVVDVVDAPVVVVVACCVVVVVVDSPAPNAMSALACAPPASPNDNVQVAPAACCAVVGGHGNDAASVAGAFPELSVAGHDANVAPPQGGPVVPSTTLKLAETAPDAEVEVSALPEIPVHETGTVSVFPTTLIVTVGWADVSLHSRMVPVELSSNPEPVTAMD